MGDYVFRRLTENEAVLFYQLIEDRIHWMDEIEISHWNKFGYLDIYPLTYFEEKCSQELAYGLFLNGRLCAACVLLEEDKQWETTEDEAYYIHNFVSDHNVQNSGRDLLKCVEDYALARKKSYMRLDSVADQEKLILYYESNGFRIVRKIKYGPFDGLLWQKKIM